MSWRDRQYSGGGYGGENYLSSPAGILSFTLPFGTWFGCRVRLHFWLLLAFLFMTMGSLGGRGSLVMLPVSMALLFAALMLHEFAHRWAARLVGGDHWEFVLWPAGGMVPPSAPPRPGAKFIAHVGGIAMNLALAVACGIALGTPGEVMRFFTPWGLLGILGGAPVLPMSGGIWQSIVAEFLFVNAGIVAINLLPYYWFDGGYLLEAIIWPWTGRRKAISVTCIVGMVVAVPMFLLAMRGMDFLGMIFWALLFSSAYVKRREAMAGWGDELEEDMSYAASLRAESPRRRKWADKWRAKAAVKEAARDRQEQEKVDAILAKVHDQGMASLNWLERRTLRKASQRQQRRERYRRGA